MSGPREIGPRSREIVAREQRHIAPGYQSFALYSGLAMARGSGATLWDEDGNEYLDLYGGHAVAAIGHSPKAVREAIAEQAGRLLFYSNLVYNPQRAEAAKQAADTARHGGQIVDADLVRRDGSADRDGWQGIAPLVNISSTQATDSVTVDNDGSDGAAAVIHSAGPDDLFDTIKPDILVLALTALSISTSDVRGQRSPAQQLRAVLEHRRNQVTFGAALENAVFGFAAGQRRGAELACRPLHVDERPADQRREAEVTHLACFHQFDHCHPSLFNWNLRVGSMQLVEIDDIGLQSRK